MLSKEEALEEYVTIRVRMMELGDEQTKLNLQARELDRQLKECKVIILAEQVKPQREPKKGGYQPRGESKRIVAQILAANTSWMTSGMIKEAAGLTSDQVQDALRELRKEGYINRDGTQGRHVYQLAIRKENENQDNSNNSIGKLSDVPSFVQFRAGTDDAFNR